METGDATSLEANKIAVESISARTAADLNRAELQAKIQQLNTMTGDSDDSFEDVTYPPVETLPPADVLSEAYMSGNPLLESMENTLEIDRRTVALNRGLSLPQFEVGYRHDYGEGRATGFKVGMSVPLFENKNKVKAAKAAAVSSQAQLESARTNAASQFRMLYDQAVALSESMRSMRSALASQNSLEILGKALDAGQISVIDYFTEANLLFESRGTLLQIERVIYCVFQCNSYTRAKTLFTDHVTCFNNATAVLVPDIYPGREKDDGTVHARDMVAGINAGGGNAIYLGTFEEIRKWLDAHAAPGDVVITLGSGDVYKQTKKLL